MWSAAADSPRGKQNRQPWAQGGVAVTLLLHVKAALVRDRQQHTNPRVPARSGRGSARGRGEVFLPRRARGVSGIRSYQLRTSKTRHRQHA